MLNRIINKLYFIKKFPRKLAELILSAIIIFDELFWRFRIFAFTLIFGKRNRIGKALIDLKKTGFAIIPKYYPDSEIIKIKEECIKQLDQLPADKIGSTDNISNLILENNLRVEKLKSSIRIKGLQGINLFFKKIGRDFKSNVITLIYHLSFSKPFLVYNITHDGSLKHPLFSKSNGKETIAGKPHVDVSVHQLRGGIMLTDIKKENGPTVFYKNSMSLNEIKQNHLNLLLEKFDFKTNPGGSTMINDEKLKFLEEKTDKISVTGNKGDLFLLDLKTAHAASPLEKGQRHILWFYF